MSQVKTGQLMSLELLPIQVPEAATESATVFSRQAVIPQSLNTKLRLQPGEFSELVVRIKNHGDDPLQLQFLVTGDNPPDWWQLRTEGSILPSDGGGCLLCDRSRFF